jgi:hypothetical protein
MKKTTQPKDPDLVGAAKALKRAAANALKLARKTNTPCYVCRDGEIVDVAGKKRSLKGEV